MRSGYRDGRNELIGCRVATESRASIWISLLDRRLADVNLGMRGAKSEQGTMTYESRGPALISCDGFPRHYSARATDAMQLFSSVQKRHAYYHIHL